MKLAYDAETDTLRIVLSDAPIAESDEDNPGVSLDYDAAGNLVGIEVLQASERVDKPGRIDRLPG